jgi:hypothetical protein
MHSTQIFVDARALAQIALGFHKTLAKMVRAHAIQVQVALAQLAEWTGVVAQRAVVAAAAQQLAVRPQIAALPTARARRLKVVLAVHFKKQLFAAVGVGAVGHFHLPLAVVPAAQGRLVAPRRAPRAPRGAPRAVVVPPAQVERDAGAVAPQAPHVWSNPGKQVYTCYCTS